MFSYIIFLFSFALFPWIVYPSLRKNFIKRRFYIIGGLILLFINILPFLIIQLISPGMTDYAIDQLPVFFFIFISFLISGGTAFLIFRRKIHDQKIASDRGSLELFSSVMILMSIISMIIIFPLTYRSELQSIENKLYEDLSGVTTSNSLVANSSLGWSYFLLFIPLILMTITCIKLYQRKKERSRDGNVGKEVNDGTSKYDAIEID